MASRITNAHYIISRQQARRGPRLAFLYCCRANSNIISADPLPQAPPPSTLALSMNRGQRDGGSNTYQQKLTSRYVQEELADLVKSSNQATQKPSLAPSHLQQRSRQRSRQMSQAPMERKRRSIRRQRTPSRNVKKGSDAIIADLSQFAVTNQTQKPSHTEPHMKQQRDRRMKQTSLKTRRNTGKSKRRTSAYASSTPTKVAPKPLARNTSLQHDVNATIRENRNDRSSVRFNLDDTVRESDSFISELAVRLPRPSRTSHPTTQSKLEQLYQQQQSKQKNQASTKMKLQAPKKKKKNGPAYVHSDPPNVIAIEQPISSTTEPTNEPTFVRKIGIFINELVEEVFFLCGEPEATTIPDPLTENFKEKTNELIELTNKLKEKGIEEEKTRAKLIEVEVERLNKLLPKALWMFMNGERRQEMFTSDHIRSLLRLHLDEASFTRKSTWERNFLLAELERINHENPDLLQVTARLYL
eukprot:scaffold5280_cov90-Skeletonema_dohrnii-CCMP3373.AAC.7